MRQRYTDNGRVEESAIDVVLVSADLEDDIKSLNIDEERKYSLTKITKNKKGKETKTISDRNILECNIDIRFKRKKESPKEELYNLKNKSCQEKFQKYTNTTSMKKIFDSDKDINILAKKFLKSLNGAIIKCFKKIRNTKRRDVKLVELYAKRNLLKEHIEDKQVKILLILNNILLKRHVKLLIRRQQDLIVKLEDIMQDIYGN